jgi:hypothetical protein
MSVSLDTSFLNDVGAKPFFPPPSPLQRGKFMLSPFGGNGANLDINNTFVAIKIKSYEVEQIIGD